MNTIKTSNLCLTALLALAGCSSNPTNNKKAITTWHQSTHYSQMLIDSYTMLDIEDTGNWHKLVRDETLTPSVQYIMTTPDVESCITEVTNRFILPLLNNKGFNFKSLQEVNAQPHEIIIKIGDILNNQPSLTETTHTFFIHCMVDKGYSFDKN